MDFSFPDHSSDTKLASYADSFSVSAFDHWLTKEEYFAEPIVHYSEAVEKGYLSEYQTIEDKFLALFEALIGGGIIIFDRSYNYNRTLNTYPNLVFKNKRFRGFKSEVRRLIVRLVREAPGLSHIDFYIPQYRLRVLKDNAFTHKFYFEDEAFVEPVLQMVRDARLHILR